MRISLKQEHKLFSRKARIGLVAVQNSKYNLTYNTNDFKVMIGMLYVLSDWHLDCVWNVMWIVRVIFELLWNVSDCFCYLMEIMLWNLCNWLFERAMYHLHMKCLRWCKICFSRIFTNTYGSLIFHIGSQKKVWEKKMF